jgi:hypothetical protein
VARGRPRPEQPTGPTSVPARYLRNTRRVPIPGGDELERSEVAESLAGRTLAAPEFREDGFSFVITFRGIAPREAVAPTPDPSARA